jgi:hypothetical protein
LTAARGLAKAAGHVVGESLSDGSAFAGRGPGGSRRVSHPPELDRDRLARAGTTALNHELHIAAMSKRTDERGSAYFANKIGHGKG